MTKRVIFIISFLITICYSYSQHVILKGSITDSILRPLPYINILAFPQVDNQEPAFAIADENGNYRLELQKKTCIQNRN